MSAPTPSRLPALLGLLLALPFIVPLGGGLCVPDGPSPCQQDRLGCEDPEDPDFYLASCPAEVTGPLQVELGTGEMGFEAFAPGAGPIVHFGPQGGQHVFLGVRVKNPRLDLSEKLKVRFYLGQGPDCAPPMEGSDPSCAMRLGGRTLYLGAPGFPPNVNGMGQVEEFGLIVFVEVPSASVPRLVSVTVEDPCRRTGSAHQAWTNPP